MGEGRKTHVTVVRSFLEANVQVANTKEAKYDRGMEERVLLARLHKAKNGGALRRADFKPGRYFLVWCC